MNLTRIAILVLLGTGTMLGESPRDGREGGSKGRDGGRSFGHFFETADSNGDGTVSRDEFFALERISKIPSEKQGEIFKRFDKNGDGRIQPDEMRPPQKPGGGNRSIPRLHELDKDKDGRVSFEEFSAGPLAKRMPEDRLKLFFGRLDTNGDGSLSPEDRPSGRRGPREHRSGPQDRKKMIEALDKDGDEVLSFGEFRQAHWLEGKSEDEQEDIFEDIDKNDDLLIDKSELMDGGKAGSPRGPEGKAPRSDRQNKSRGLQGKEGKR